ncbi:MAG: hypothetical protein JEY71_04500 [Sphaerochaeta sp.]|nr:hypothetical protein [Sphaerochaeta sp.]
MKYKAITCIVLIVMVSVSLFSLALDIPNEVPAYQNLSVILTPSPSEGTVKEARFFFYQEGKREPLYSEFAEEKGVWIAKVPYTYLTDEELVYFAVMQNMDGKIFRSPQMGEQKARLIKDTNPPKLELLSPASFALVKGKEQLIVFKILDESALSDFTITLDGQQALRSGVFGQYLSLLVGPSDKKESVVQISMKDRYGNSTTEEYTFTISAEKAPSFVADANYQTNLELAYVLGMGKSANTTNIESVLSDLDHALDVSFELGGDAYLKAGPVALELQASLKDSLSAFEILDAYPNTLLADLQNILNLYNPINFANEFDYTGDIVRKYENDNSFLVKISLFGPILSYQFGDQKITFQKETINDLGLRGSSIGIDLPFFELMISKGLTDLGLYQVAWPQNFFGFKTAIKAREAWYLQTNISFISSLQGRYESLKTGSASPIGSLYGLGSVTPDQNMVMGLSTGFDNRFFTLDATFSLSLYNDNASSVLDVNQLATDLKDQGGPDVSTYVGYLDKIQGVFPILDYFLPTNGLIAGVVDKDLWGISYGADVNIPSVGMDIWIRKTDATYKSLGSSVATDEFTYGAFAEKSFAKFTFSGGYSYKKDTIADILFNDIIALVKPDLAPTSEPTVNDIANILHTAQAGVNTPQYKVLGTLKFDYTFAWETTDAEALAAKATAAVATAIRTSSDNDVTNTHTGELRWRSGRYKAGDFTMNFGAKTKDSYVIQSKVDGTSSDTTFWEYSYGVSGGVNYQRYALTLGFDHAWSTEAASLTSMGYDAKFAIKDTFFDTISITGSFDQAFKSSLEAYKITTSLALDKRFGPISTSAVFDVSYYDSLVDNTADTLNATLTVKGVFSK